MEPVKIVLKAGAQTLNLKLKVASTAQQVTVAENVGPVLSTESTSNASQLVFARRGSGRAFGRSGGSAGRSAGPRRAIGGAERRVDFHRRV